LDRLGRRQSETSGDAIQQGAGVGLCRFGV